MSSSKQIIEAMQALVNALRHEEEVCAEVAKAEKILHDICTKSGSGPLPTINGPFPTIDKGGGDGP